MTVEGTPGATAPETARKTVDAFHYGAFHVVQPYGQGHRSGSDAMLLAALVPDGSKGRLADLGAGCGAAGMAVASRVPGLSITLVERSPEMAGFARQSIGLDVNRHLRSRLELVEADVELTGKARIAAGLQDTVFDHVIMNPPFNHPADRKTPDALKAEAHAMSVDMFDRWLRTANAIARPGGQLSLIARPQSVAEIIDACGSRFGGLHVTMVHPHRQASATRLLLTGIKGSRARLEIRRPLFMHETGETRFTPLVADLNNGRTFIAR
jgi:tRNA1(Val) A37 N6-methylase TrmN6